MIYEVVWVENKNADWKVATLREKIDGGKEVTDVSINRTNKQGQAFPNFDGIAPGAEVHGEFWRSPANKNYLFPPKPQTPRSGGGGAAFKGKQIEEAQNRTHEHVKEAQESKGQAIKVAAAMRDATLLAICVFAVSTPETI